ncbi:MAG: flagellar hook-length control protein FliK [Thermodesulfovibrionales bacterium]
MQIPVIVTNDNNYSFYRSFGKALQFSVGDIVKAEVIKSMASGTVSLRITTDAGETGLIAARTNLPLATGSQVMLRVAGGHGEIRLQLVGTASEGSLINNQPPPENIPSKLIKMLSEFAGTRLKNEDILTLKEVFARIPDGIKVAFPEFRALEELMPQIAKINPGLLQKSVEGSGVLFETKLKLVSQEMIHQAGDGSGSGFVIEGDEDQVKLLQQVIRDGSVLNAVKAAGTTEADIAAIVDKVIKNVMEASGEGAGQTLHSGGSEHASVNGKLVFTPETDQKALLLRLGDLLRDSDVVSSLKAVGVNAPEVSKVVDRLLKNIEFFQLSSKVNDVLYTFLPVTWPEMRDGEITFRQEARSGSRAFTCDINLDLTTLGRLAVSVTLFEGAYHVTFYAEDARTRSLIEAEKSQLEKGFSEGGMPLRIVNVSAKQSINFGVADKKGLDIKV